MTPPPGVNPLVFPTPVGMNRREGITRPALWCVPHARGDEPTAIKLHAIEAECSPRPWG